MGHNFGMLHDFDDKHSDTDCNGQGIMSYGDPPSKWSPCSVKDFNGYYNSKKWGTTCLKGNIINLLNYISMDFILMTTQDSTFRFT